jgi:hypothetical protein
LVDGLIFYTTQLTVTVYPTIGDPTGMLTAYLMSLDRLETTTAPLTLSHLIPPRIRAPGLVGDHTVDPEQLTGVARLPGLHLLVDNPDRIFVDGLIELYESSPGSLFDQFSAGAYGDDSPDHTVDTIHYRTDILFRHRDTPFVLVLLSILYHIPACMPFDVHHTLVP